MCFSSSFHQAKRDVPAWMYVRGEVWESGYQGMRGAVGTNYAKLLDDVQLISVVFAPSGRDSYCFRTSLNNTEDGAPTIRDATVLEAGRAWGAFPMDQPARRWGALPAQRPASLTSMHPMIYPCKGLSE